MSHPRLSLDAVIHAPVRFSIVAALAVVDEADFRSIRDTVGVTDSALSKQLAVLESSGYVSIRKAFIGKRPRTYASLTVRGRRSWKAHVDALREIAG